MTRFYFQRDRDPSGVSGVGKVAEGVIFTSGWVALTWIAQPQFTSIAVYPNIQTVEQIHGHQGMTRIISLDEPRDTRVFDR